jgi:hypothetical protein
MVALDLLGRRVQRGIVQSLGHLAQGLQELDGILMLDVSAGRTGSAQRKLRELLWEGMMEREIEEEEEAAIQVTVVLVRRAKRKGRRC